MGSERIRLNVAGALQITEAHYREKEAALQEDLAAKDDHIRGLQDRLEKMTSRTAIQEQEIRTIQGRFEESLTKLSQRKSSKNDSALLRRISELEEQLAERDEAFGASTTTATKVKRQKPSSVAIAASSSRSLTKKFKIKKSIPLS